MNDSITAGTRPAAPLSQADASAGVPIAQQSTMQVATAARAGAGTVESVAANTVATTEDSTVTERAAAQAGAEVNDEVSVASATEGSTATECADVASAAPVAAAAIGDSQVDATADGSQPDDPAADPDAEPDAEPELTFEQRVDHLRDVVHSNPRFREIHFRTLEFCLEQRELGEVEQMIAALPEFKTCGQNQYRLILFMENAEGLERFELDEDGKIVTPERKEGLTDDEIDDLVLTYAFKTTDVGRAVYDEMRPQKRLNKLFSAFPKRVKAYRDVLEFCTQPRSFKDIDNLLAGSDVLKSGSLNTATNVPLQPSVFIDQLERNGGLVGDGSWNITAEGRRLLELAQEAK